LPDGGAARPQNRGFLHGTRVDAFNGEHEAEQRDGQTFVIDVDWWFDSSEVLVTDQLEQRICCQAIQATLVRAATSRRFNLIEALTDHIAGKLLCSFELIDRLKVTVHKPMAPLDAPFTDVGLTIVRSRSELGDSGSASAVHGEHHG
jgi:7,8-dihydroneopterin aldolase/epimerase/oxygenase